MNNDRVLITYGWCRNTYSIMRNLAQHGLAVYVGGPSERTMCSVSRYCSGSFVYPSPYLFPHEFIEAVIAAARRFETKVYLPVHEEIFVVAKYKELFPDWLTIPITTLDNLYRCYDKATTMQLCEQLGVPLPKTFYPTSVDEVGALVDNASFPLIIKLRRSNSGKGIKRVWEPNNLIESYEQIMRIASYPPIIQEYIEGESYFEIDVCYNKGKEVASFCRKNIRFKSKDGGSASKALSIEAPEMLAATRKIFEYLGWHGVASCEFVHSSKTGKSYLFEINPRYWGTLPFDIDCGVEFPWYHFLIATDREIGKLPDYPRGKSSIWIIGDLIGFTEHFSSWKNVLSQIKEYLPIDIDYCMDFKKEDPYPFLQQAWYYLEKFLRTGSKNPIDEGMIG